LLP
ncbi:glutathione S-transferase, N-terminal domain protein, partial [Vibrio parahaemolyticus SBR10290]|jgi:hypothetical protein